MVGLGCLIIYPISLVFLILHWQKAKNPFFLQLFGTVIALVAGFFDAELSIYKVLNKNINFACFVQPLTTC